MAITAIRHPELTAEERARRMEAIKKAVIDLVIATERVKRSK
jgi:hypothetical protein